ncbi:MAG: PQQ-dependent sugar dehydrogenase [Planctomycetota bacterium]
MTLMRTSVLSLVLALAAGIGAAQENVPAGFLVENLATGLSSPTDFAFLPDGRVLITQQSTGQVRLWVPSLGTSLTTVGSVPNLTTGSERGLLSIAVDPNFATNGYIYLWWSRSAPSMMELARFTCTGNLTSGTSSSLSFATSSRFTLVQAPDNAFNHNGGTCRFGPDGMLYQTIGDDANMCNAQSNTTYSGKVLRMNVATLPAGSGTATVAQLDPGDNPMSGSTNGPTALAIAKGLRNPFSANMDPVTGDLFIADVGLSTREEYDQYVRNLGSPPAFVNFGWPMREGFVGGPQPTCAAQTGLTDPIDDRNYGSGGTSIMSAGVYRNMGGGFDWGMSYEGNVFHNDYSNGTVERLMFNGTAWVTAPSVPGQPSANFWGTGFQGCTHFEVGPDGSMYFCDNSGNTFRRIRTMGPINEFHLVSGGGQVGLRDTTFAQPIVLELQTPGGSPVPGATVNLSVSANGSLPGPTTMTTDAMGRVSFMLDATAGGSVVVTATTPGGSTTGETFSCFARQLGMNFLVSGANDIVVASLTNFSNGTDPVPFLFAMSDQSAPTYSTAYGPLAVDLFTLVNTYIIEDPLGAVNGNITLGGFGTPSKSNVYFVPTGLLFGTLRFQAIWLDGTTPTSILGVTPNAIGLSNVITHTF